MKKKVLSHLLSASNNPIEQVADQDDSDRDHRGENDQQFPFHDSTIGMPLV